MPGKFSNTDLSREVAEKFLSSYTTEDVKDILDKFPEFAAAENWKPYGKAEKNWDRVGVQTSEPVGALAELIINSIDAILMRRAEEEGVAADGISAPNGMTEAVKAFFPEVQEGRLTLLSPEQRTKLAENSVLIGIRRKPRKTSIYPSYTIVDFGEGQNHDDFEKTFLSLGEKNKEGIQFVQGRFNMGSTGSITFCTQANPRKGLYKFILSKRAAEGSNGLWGWTLIRIRDARKGEALPVVEYFCPDEEIACFQSEKLRAFEREDIGMLEGGGSVVKLFEYDIGPGARSVDIGLHDALTTNLIDCALPIRLYDFDAQPDPARGGLREEGIAPRTFSGMKVVLRGDDGEGNVEVSNTIINSENPDLGTIEISYFGLKLKDYLRKHDYRVFYTINGQSQAKERASFLRKSGLDDLRDYLIVQVDCSKMDNTARATIFKADRERMSDIEVTRELKEIVIESLKGDRKLREYAREIRSRRVTNQIKDESDKEFLSTLTKNSPDLQELFDMGTTVVAETFTSGGDDPFEGKQFPTFLKPRNLQEGNIKLIPINTHRRIECTTDAQDDYLTRENDRGSFLHPLPDVLPNTANLRNGKLDIKVMPPEDAKVGDEIFAKFGFSDSSRVEPLVFQVRIRITEEEALATSPSGKPKGVKQVAARSKQFPDIVWVEKVDWDEHGFDEDSGASVSEGESLTVYVNRGNKYLASLSTKERDDSERELIAHRFKYGVGILTLAMYKRLVRDEDKSEKELEYDPTEIVKAASSAIAAHTVTLIEKLGGAK